MDADAIKALLGDTPHELDASTMVLSVDGLDHDIDLTNGDQWFPGLLNDAMPRSPRGDYRERTVNLLIRNAIPDPGRASEDLLIGKDGNPGNFFEHPDVP